MQACALRLSFIFFLLQLVATSYAATHIIDPNNSIYSVLSLASVYAGDIVIINSGTYPSETPYILDKNLTITIVGEVNVSMAVTSPSPTYYWLTINSTVTMGGSGSLTLNNYGIVLGPGKTLTQNVSIEVVDTKYGAMIVGESGVWDQLKDFSVTHDSSFDVDQEQIVLGSQAQWSQNGAVSILSVNATGVSLGIYTSWLQYGAVSIDVSSESLLVSAVQMGGFWWSQGPGISLELFGAATQGVILRSGSNWFLNCPVNINQTSVAVGILISGTWRQSGVLTMTSKGSEKGVGWDSAGGVWDQFVQANFVFDQGYAVYFDGGGQWNQEEAIADFQLTSHAYGVHFEMGGFWNQSGATKMILGDTSGGVFMNGGHWVQREQINITTLTLGSDAGSAVAFNGTGTWEQDATAYVSGVQFNNPCAGCQWLQSAELFLSSFMGVQVLGGGLWQQDGPAQINVTSYLSVRAVFLDTGSVWRQRASVSLNIGASDANAVGVFLSAQSKWIATAPTTIVGTKLVVGVSLNGDAEYSQGGTLNISIEGLLIDIALRRYSAGVLFANGAPVWRQLQPATLRVANGTGVRFGGSLGATWQQLARTTITIQGDAAAIDLARGGQWNQLQPATIATVAQGSSPAITTGIVCGGSSTCCNRIQSPLYLFNIIFAPTLPAASVRDDCPTASPSPSPLAIRPVVVNTTATFANSTPSISIAGTASGPSSGGTETREVAVQLSLTDLLVGNSSATPTDYTVTQQVTNSTSGGANTTTTTYVYAAQLDNATSVAQAYTFFAQKATTAFAGTTFTVGAGSLKWSLNLTTAAGVGLGSQGLTLRYELASLLAINASSPSVVPEAEAVIRKPNTPQNQMTTYIVRLDDDAVAQVELFDVALVDAQLVFINHSLTATNVSANGTTVRSYVLELQLPAFNQSLFYDPSLGLGVLLGGSTKSDGSGSDDNTALIVATAVAIPVAVVVVVGVVAVALLVAWKKTRDRSALELDHVLDNHDESL